MPGLETDDLNEFAVLLRSGSYDRHGQIGVTDVPEEIKCRWVENVVSEPMSSGDVAGVTATVYLDQDIDLSSVLWHGRKRDFPRDWQREANGLMEVANFHSLKDVQGKETRRWVDLTRFRDALPRTG